MSADSSIDLVEDPPYLELEESDVQSIINSVKIIEERFNENAEIRLNEDQLLIELTNLFYTDIADLDKDKNRGADALMKKTNRFMSLIAEIGDASIGPKSHRDVKRVIMPIINAVKVLMLTDSDEDVDEAFEEDNQVSMIDQTQYLKRFTNLTGNKTQSVQSIVPQLYLWTRGWKDPQTTKGLRIKFSDAVDALMMFGADQERIRLAGADDDCDVIGVVIETPKAAKTLHERSLVRYRLSITEYFAALESFAPGDQVSVCLNDFFEDIGGLGDRCTHQARVVRSVPGHGLFIDVHRVTEVFVPFRKYSPIMVFKDNKNHFNKRDFYLHDAIEVIFDPTLSFEQNVAFARPISASEALFMNFDRARSCYNFHQVEKVCLRPFGYTLRDIDYVSLAKLKQVLHLKPNVPEPPARAAQQGRPVKLPAILETIKNWKTYCEHKRERLETFVKRIERHESSIQEEIHQIQRALVSLHGKNTCDNNTQLGRVAMRVGHISELSDEPADLYFSPSHDPTDYKIKENIQRDNPRIDELELTSRIRAEVSKNNPKLLKSEVEFEVKSIIKGRRKIRMGDYAALSGPGGESDIVYKLTMIESRPMWIKVFKVPYKSCDASILERARQDLDTVDPQQTCVFDTYDKICKSIEEAKLNHRLAVLSAQQEILKDVQAFIDSEDIQPHIVAYFEDLQKAGESGRRRAEIAIIEGISIEDDLDRYFGDAEYIDADAMYANPDAFGDAFAPLLPRDMAEEGYIRRTAGDDAAAAGVSTKVLAVLENLCDVLGLSQTSIGEAALDNIVTSVVIDNPDIPVDKDLFYKSKFKSVNQELYKTKPSYRKTVDEMIAKKYKEEVAKVSGDYYYRVHVHLCALLCLFIMAKYPAVTFNTVLSSCAASLAYSGYPIKERGDARSIYAYIACVLKAMSTPDDERLANIYKASADALRDAIEERAVGVLEVRQDIAAAIEGNRVNLASTLKKLAQGASEHEHLFHGFKPEARAYKLSNPGKVELKPDIRFDVEHGSAHKQHRPSKAAKQSGVADAITNIYIPPSKPDIRAGEQSLYFEKVKLDHEVDMTESIKWTGDAAEETETVRERIDALELSVDNINLDDNDWWDSVMYNGLDSRYDEIMQFLGWSGAATLKSYLITLDDSTDSINTVLHTFIGARLPMLLSRLLNSKVDTSVDSEQVKMIAINMANGNATEVGAVMKECIDYIGNIRDRMWIYHPVKTPTEAIKNKMVLVCILLDILRLISMIDKTQYEMFQQGEVQLGGDVAMVVCGKLLSYLDNSLKKQEDIKKRIEELREKRKTELMGAYKANDEDRQLQMTLKSMGLKTWFDVGEGEDGEEPAGGAAAAADLVAPAPTNVIMTAEEAENYRMGDYGGMNDDGDDDEDLYYQIRAD
jgi:hypothetical protein